MGAGADASALLAVWPVEAEGRDDVFRRPSEDVAVLVVRPGEGMKEKRTKWVVPDKPVDIDEVIRRFPTVRQSLMAKFDDCELSTLFELRYANGWSTHPQARGTMFHRVAAECLRVMREQDQENIPVGVALSILEEMLYQRGVDPRDRVRVPLRELPGLEMAVAKFAKDNSFTVRNIIDVERRITAKLAVPHFETGELVERELTGQLDALIARPPDEALVLDWKDTWALPPEREEDADDPGVSYHGYFQQFFYAWLVMMNYPAIQAVVLREFYVRRSKSRPARVVRADLPKIEQRLRYLVSAFDRAVASGNPENLRIETLDAHGSWKPSPGKHCHWCAASQRCPISSEARPDAGIETPADAEKWAGIRVHADAVRKRADAALKPYAELHGPVPVKRSKGRLVLGFRKVKGGTRWGEFTPEGADRPPTREAYNPNLTAAMEESVREARETR